MNGIDLYKNDDTLHNGYMHTLEIFLTFVGIKICDQKTNNLIQKTTEIRCESLNFRQNSLQKPKHVFQNSLRKPKYFKSKFQLVRIIFQLRIIL